MFRSLPCWPPLMVGIWLLCGCCGPLHPRAELRVRDLEVHTLDAGSLPAADRSEPPPAPENPAPPTRDPVQNTSFILDQADEAKPKRPGLEQLQIPRELPGGQVPPLKLPRDPKERVEAIDRLFPKLADLPADVRPQPGPDRQPLTLARLQEMARDNNPAIRQALADVEAARGAAIQAGLYPNPTVGYSGQNIGEDYAAGFQGGFIEQVIKAPGKIKLAQAAAVMELRNAQAALQRAQADLANDVRARYFEVLVARENHRVSRALAHLADDIFRVHLEQLKAAQVAAYEPMQMRVLAIQARGQLVKARNREVAAWTRLAATLGLPDLPPTELAGQVDMPVPVYEYQPVLERILASHTDVQMAENSVLRHRYLLRLAQITPRPDVNVQVEVYKNYNGPPFNTVVQAMVGVPIPVWDRNQGNIRQAEFQLARAIEEQQRVRNDLTARLAEAFQRYQNSRQLVDYYRNSILPDQVIAFRGAYERHQQEPDKVGFVDVVNAQQTLANSISTYLTELGDLWTAVADLAHLLQTLDLYGDGEDCQK